jgi:xanthine/uracil permease
MLDKFQFSIIANTSIAKFDNNKTHKDGSANKFLVGRWLLINISVMKQLGLHSKFQRFTIYIFSQMIKAGTICKINCLLIGKYLLIEKSLFLFHHYKIYWHLYLYFQIVEDAHYLI